VDCVRVVIEALSAAFFAPGYNNEGCASLPVPPPAAVQGLIAAATGNVNEHGFKAAWMMHFSSLYEDYEKIVPARRDPAMEDFEPYRTGYRLVRTPVRRKYLIEPRLILYVEERLAVALCMPHHSIRLGRSQDLAWVSDTLPVKLEPVSESDVQGVVVPFQIPEGGMASFLWVIHDSAEGYDERNWINPRAYAFLSKRQRLRGLTNFYRDPELGLAVPLYEL
jgi:CRISPR-associated Cas5-like protein